MIDISIDLETLSSDPRGASIATIGVAAQNFETGELWQAYIVVDDPLGIIEPRTVRWHVAKGDPESTIGVEHVTPLKEGLETLSMMLRTLQAKKEGEARIWTHATFDIPQLGAAYKRAGWKYPPWHYRNCRDLRTLYDLAGGRPAIENADKHNALADANAQLQEVRQCLTTLGRIYPRP